jgi:hypothetical protein
MSSHYISCSFSRLCSWQWEKTKVTDSEAATPALLNYPRPSPSLAKGEATDIRAAVSIGPIIRIRSSQDYFNSYG